MDPKAIDYESVAEELEILMDNDVSSGPPRGEVETVTVTYLLGGSSPHPVIHEMCRSFNDDKRYTEEEKKQIEETGSLPINVVEVSEDDAKATLPKAIFDDYKSRVLERCKQGKLPGPDPVPEKDPKGKEKSVPDEDHEPESDTSVRQRKRAKGRKEEVTPLSEAPARFEKREKNYVRVDLRYLAIAATALIVIFLALVFGGSDVYNVASAQKRSIFVDDKIGADRAQCFSIGTEESSTVRFVRGYSLMRDVCEVISRDEGWYDIRPERYSVLAPLSTVPSQPYFCVNNLLNIYAGHDFLNMRQRQEQKWAMIRRIQAHMPGDAVDLAEQVLEVISITHQEGSEGERISQIDDLSNAPIASLGYLRDALLFRNMESLAGANPDAQLNMLKYNRLADLSDSLMHEIQQSQDRQGSYCICGPHMHMARSIVMIVGPRSQRLFVEPKIEKVSGNIMTLSPSDFAWNQAAPSEKTPLGDALRIIDAKFLELLGSEKSVRRYHSDVTVESIRMFMDDATDDEELSLFATDGRVVTQATGSEAICLQYCHQMAFDLMDLSSSFFEESNRISI